MLMFVYLIGWRLNAAGSIFFFVVREKNFFFYNEMNMFVERVRCLTNIEYSPTVFFLL
jgi:hypothetical protein